MDALDEDIAAGAREARDREGASAEEIAAATGFDEAVVHGWLERE